MDDFEKEILRLRRIYKDAESVILQHVRRLDDLPSSADRAKRLERVAALEKETKAEIAHLTKAATTWTRTNIDKAYRAGLKEERADIKAVTGQIVAGFGKYHTAAVATLKNQMLDRIGDVSTKMGRQTVNVYSEAKLGVNMLETLAGTESVSKLARRLRDDMMDKGITGFVDKRGREWKVSTYAEMLARTSVMNAMLTAKTTELQACGYDLVRVSRHLGAEGSDHDCELCRPWEGKVLSISGDDKKYPSLDQAKVAGLFHPNCKHSVHLFVDYDDEATEEPNIDDRDKLKDKDVEEGEGNPATDEAPVSESESDLKNETIEFDFEAIGDEEKKRWAREAFENSPRAIQAVVKTFEEDLKSFRQAKEVAHFSPHRREIVITKGERETAFKDTFIHEFGHLVDHNYQVRIEPGKYTAFASSRDEYKEEYEALRNVFSGRRKEDVALKAELKTMFESAEWSDNASFSDLICSLSHGNVHGKWGHSKGYYKKSPTLGRTEAFADMFALMAKNDEKAMAEVKRLFPGLHKTFLGLLAKMTGGV